MSDHDRRRLRRRRCLGSDHALAGRDGRTGGGDEAPQAGPRPSPIGGATTSRQHTAVKIAPGYDQPTIHVLDASRVVGVLNDLLDPERRAALDGDNRADQQRLRTLHEEKQRKPRLSIAGARANRTPIDWSADASCRRRFSAPGEIAPTIGELRDSIDWTFFFHAWELKGRFPAILDDPRQGPVARDLYAAATALLDGIEADELLRARGVYGFWSAAAEQDDIALAGGERFSTLRQQADYGDSRPNRSLADFVAPADTGLADHVGAFAVAIHGAEALARDYEDRHDDYSAIIVKALADRLAEAFAEWLHGQVRTSWYAPDEELARDDIVSWSATGASDPRSAIPPAPTTRRRGRCSAFSMPAVPVASSPSRAR